MEVYISQQLFLFGGAVLLGLCMGLCYDVLRAFRVRFPRVGGWLDGLYCVLCACAVFLFVLRWGGELRMYILLGCAGGCVLFFCLLSELLRPLWAVWVELVVFLVRCLLFPMGLFLRALRKVLEYAKNLFLFCGKWFTIWNYKWTVIRIHRERSAADVNRQNQIAKRPAKGGKAGKSAKRSGAGFATKLLILALLLLVGSQLYRLQGQVKAAEEEQTQLTAQVEALRQENETLAQDIENGDNQELMQKIAREELGYVFPGEKVFRIKSD